MFQFNIPIYITILLSMISCNCTRLRQDGCADSNSGNTKPLILLFHGLGARASCFNSLAKHLKQAFPTADVIALNSVEEDKTAMYAIPEQSRISYYEIEKSIPDLQTRPTLLIGHSQGGIRAYKMFHDNKDCLNVKGIITLATPWEGAPILSADYDLFAASLETPILVDEMRKFSKGLGAHTDWLKVHLNERLELYKIANLGPGFADLKPGSKFLNEIKATLPNTTIPILAIGGAQSDFQIFLTQKNNYGFKALRNAWTKLIVGKTDYNKHHDMIVTLDSQLAKNIMPRGHTNFQRLLIRDALHDEILPLPPMAASKNILKHPAMFKTVEAFAKHILYGCYWEKRGHSTKVQPKPYGRIARANEYVSY